MDITSIISSTPSAVSIAVFDKNMHFVAASEKWIHEARLNGQTLAGKSFYDIFPETSDDWRAVHAECLHGKCIKREADPFERLDGSVQWINWELIPWKEKDGAIKGIVMYAEDISSKRYENFELKRKLDLFEETNEVGRIGSWNVDLLNDQVFWSKMVYRIYGVNESVLPDLNQSIGFFKEGENREKIKMHISEAINEGKSFDADLQIINTNGEEIWVRLKGDSEIRDGKCIRIYGTIQDINELKQNTLKLIDSEEKYKSIINNSLHAFGLISKEGKVLEANQAFLKMFGYTLEEIRAVDRSQIVDTKDQNFKSYLEQRNKSGVAESRLTGIRKNGEHFLFEISSVAFTDSNDEERISISLTDITDRLRSEDSIRQSEEQFRAVFEYSGIGMALFTMDGKLERANKSLCDLLGYTEEEMLKLDLADIVFPEDLDIDRIPLHRLMDRQISSYQLEKRYVHKNGDIIWAIIGGSLLFDNEMKPSRRLYQIQNISERKSFEKTLSEERELLGKVLNNIPISIYLKDLNSRKTLVNKSEIEFLGVRSTQDIIGKNDHEFYPENIALTSIEEDQEIYKTGKSIIDKEKVLVRKNGAVSTVLVSKIPLYDNQNKIYGILGINNDITKIKEAEKSLIESERKFRKIFENIQDVFYQTDKDGILIEISPSVESYTGFKPNEMIHKPVANFYFNLEDREALLKKLAESNGSLIDYEVKLRNKKNEPWDASINMHYYFLNGEFQGIEGSIRDVSERKKQQETLKSLNDQLSILNDQKNKLLSVIAHDLRNAISGTAGLLEVLFTDIASVSRDEMVEYMGMMQKSITNAHGLLEELMEWAKAQFNSVDFNPVLIKDLKAQVQHCLKKAELIADAKQIKISEDLNEGTAISIDKHMLDTILRNLVTNAIKFSEPGTEIKVSAKEENRGVTFAVKDRGLGMSPENVNKVLNHETGFTTFGTKGEKGTGMGLGLCQNFVDRHGGKMWVESTLGKGTTFYFHLPDQQNTISQSVKSSD
jgi:PAS domain S-box-containing protein